MREVLAAVSGAKALAQARKATIDYDRLQYDIDEYLRTNGEDYWRELFTPLIAGTIEEQGREWSITLGTEWDIRNLEGEAWFQDYVLRFAQPINDTTIKGVHSVVSQAMEEGWAIPTIQDRLEQLFTQWMAGGATADDFSWYEERLPAHRTEMIARTETMRASNAGGYNLAKNWGVAYKGWLATLDGRERDSHRDAMAKYDEGGTVGVIPMSSAFMIGGYPMQHPGDSSMGAPASEFINCRCTILPYTEKPTGEPEREAE